MDRKQFIVAGSLIDGSGGPARRRVFLTVENSLITGIGPADDLPRPDGAAVHDLSHCTIVPPLVDCSVSLSWSPSVDRKIRAAAKKAGLEKKAVLASHHIRYCHAHGVLGVAAHDDGTGLFDHLKEVMPENIIIDIRASGLDFLRIIYGGGIDSEEVLESRLNRQDLGHILRQRGRKRAVVVANGPQQVKEALAAGCDAIEQGYGMGEENLREMANLGTLWIPSVFRAKNNLDAAAGGGAVSCRFSTRYLAPGKADPAAEAFWKKMLAEQLAQLRLAEKLGVKTAVGTGAGSTGILHGESVVEEMKLFIRAGWSLEETIRCASDNGARFFGLDNLGALAVGRPATFLVARGAVQQLPRKLAYLENIYVGGAPSAFYRKNPGMTG